MVFFDTANLTGFWPELFLEAPGTRRNIWRPQGNSKPHENKRSNTRAYTPTKTHVQTTINKSPLPTKPTQIFILQIHDQFHQSIHLLIQQKHDTQAL